MKKQEKFRTTNYISCNIYTSPSDKDQKNFSHAGCRNKVIPRYYLNGTFANRYMENIRDVSRQNR